MVYLSTAGAREPGFSSQALSGHGHLVMAVEEAIGSFHSPCKVRPLEVNAGPPGVGDQRCLRDISFRCLRRALSTRGRLGGGGRIDARRGRSKAWRANSGGCTRQTDERDEARSCSACSFRAASGGPRSIGRVHRRGIAPRVATCAPSEPPPELAEEADGGHPPQLRRRRLTQCF